MKKLFYKYCKRQRTKRNPCCMHWSQIRSILVLSEQPTPEIERALQKQGKSVTCVCLPNPQEISWYGRPKQVVLEQLATPVDLLLDLQQNETLAGNYMTLYAEAKLKAGRYREDEGLLDLMINMPAEESVQPLYEQIVKYLTIING